MPRIPTGRHEHGQNFLADPALVDTIVDLVAATEGPILEIGGGAGALTLPLARTRRPLTVVEIDARLAARLRAAVPEHVDVVHADYLRTPHPRVPHVVVGNLPFALTTAILRRLLAAPAWAQAVLLVQWEVARRRAAVGGATLMTAQWWPWFAFTLEGRVPASAFAPRPSVDGGLLRITRRARPDVDDRAGYQRFVRAVFEGRGRGAREILARSGALDGRSLREWLRAGGLGTARRPTDLGPEQWQQLWAIRRRHPI